MLPLYHQTLRLGWSSEANLLYATYKAAKHLRKRWHVPGVMELYGTSSYRAAELPLTRPDTRVNANAAELLYAMAQEVRALIRKGRPKPVLIRSTKIMDYQIAHFMSPLTPGWVSNSFYR